MTFDMEIWRQNVVNEVRLISDEAFQRTVWFGGGGGRWVHSPDEQFCGFFDDADGPRFLAYAGNGLTHEQTSQLARLSSMMRHLSDALPNHVRPEDIIDDPRWQAIPEQAKVTSEALSNKG